jgi:hypothetical protein
MTGWIANRLGALESRVEYLIRLIADITQQLRGVQQSAKGVGSGFQFGPSGGGGGAFFCQPSGSVAGATGTWPTLTPTSFTADVYQMVGGVLTLITASAGISNGFPAALVASKVCFVAADTSGAYVVVSQSCT